MKNLTRLAIALPCYNEALALPEILDGFVESATRNGFTSDTFQLVVVDNGSVDDTSQVLDRLLADERLRPWVRRVQVATNQGYGFGVHAGLRACDAPYVGWTHADGQCPPDDVFKAYRAAAALPNSLCMGRRVGRPVGAWLFSRAYDLVVFALLGRLVYDINAQPKVFERGLVAELRNPPLGFDFDLYVLLRAKEKGIQFQSIPVEFAERRHGSSNWSATYRSRLRTIRSVLKFVRGYAKA